MMGKLDREEKVHPVNPGELIIHFDCDNEFLNDLVDKLISGCLNKRCSMQNSWNGHTERLIVKLPPIGD